MGEVANRTPPKRSKRESVDADTVLLAELSPDLVLRMTEGGCIEFANRAALGMTTESALGVSLFTLTTDGGVAMREALKVASSDGTVVCGATEFLDPERGQTRYSWRAKRHGSGFVLALRDASDQKRVEQVERETERRQAAIFQNLPLLSYEWHSAEARTPTATTLTTVTLEGQVRAITGYDRSDLSPQRWIERVHPEDRDDVRRSIEKIRGDGERWSMQYRWETSSGEVRYFLDQGVVLASPSGGVRLCGVVLDVTERQELEEKLARSQKLEAIGQLTGGIAHDFNNFLTAIISFAGFARQTLSPDHAARDDIARVLDAADRASALTRQLLLFSRPRSSKCTAFDVNSRLESIQRLLALSLGESIEVDIKFEPKGAVILADSSQFDQVMLNLVVNARHAMSGGGVVTISVGLDDVEAGQQTLAPGRYVRVVVKDTGSGMDAATLERAFEPFFTTKGPSKGTGLGLATCYGVVTNLGGTITLESEPGKGTAVTVLIPAHSGPLEVDTAATLDSAELGGNERVLLVEDDPAVRAVAERSLTERGYSVICCADGERAIRILQEQHATLGAVVSDIVLPGRSGYEVAAFARKLEPTMPVVLASGYSERSRPAAGPSTAFGDVLWKPYTPERLARAVRAAIVVGKELKPEKPITTAPASSSSEPRVLIIDDDEHIRAALRRMLEFSGFEIEMAASAEEARAFLEGASGSLDAIICDLHLPGESGIVLYEWLCRAQPQLAAATLVVTGGGSDGESDRFIREHPERVVMKPVDARGLVSKLRALLPRENVTEGSDGK